VGQAGERDPHDAGEGRPEGSSGRGSNATAAASQPAHPRSSPFSCSRSPASQYDSALETLTRLRELIDSHLFTDALKQLQQRTWLLHWSLFVFWNIDDGRAKLIELFMTEKYMAALQISAPHLLRYLAAAYLVSKTDKDRSQKWKAQLKSLVATIVHERHAYADPVADFLKCVYRDYDFDAAQVRRRGWHRAHTGPVQVLTRSALPRTSCVSARR